MENRENRKGGAIDFSLFRVSRRNGQKMDFSAKIRKLFLLRKLNPISKINIDLENANFYHVSKK